MESALHAGHFDAAQFAENNFTGMSGHGGLRKVGNLFERHSLEHLYLIAEQAETGSANNAHLRREAVQFDGVSDRFDGLVGETVTNNAEIRIDQNQYLKSLIMTEISCMKGAVMFTVSMQTDFISH